MGCRGHGLREKMTPENGERRDGSSKYLLEKEAYYLLGLDGHMHQGCKRASIGDEQTSGLIHPVKLFCEDQ